MVFSASTLSTIAVALAAAQLAAASSLADVKHVVYLMQENRAFDHYFGTMAGVRGFKDPNVVTVDGKPIWYQPTNSDKADYLLPFYLAYNSTYKGGAQCANGGSNDWTPNHNAWNGGLINGWVTNNSEYAWGHYQRSDIPVHFEIAETWTVADMYAEFVIGPTAPNRASWISGSLNIGGTLGEPETVGGPYIENWSTNGCEYNGATPYDCYPLKWNTMPENLEAQNISWFTYRDADSTNDDPMFYFENYIDANSTDPLAVKGLQWLGLAQFLDDVANGTLPEVSWIVGSFPLSEHPPHTPHGGSWYQEKVIETIRDSPYYDDTVIFISYDETGGWGDHVPPFVAPNGTDGEWTTDPENLSSYIPAGPGFRLPFYAISPWTTGGHVFTEPADHTSQLMFLEKWAEARGKNVTLDTINPWRRQHMSDLTNMFHFQQPNWTKPALTNVTFPEFADGEFTETTVCQDTYAGHIQIPVPYGNQTEEDSLWTESGYKPVRGALTEGRYLVFTQAEGWTTHALAYGSSYLEVGTPAHDYSTKSQRFVLHQVGDAFSHQFRLATLGGKYVTASGRLTSSASAGAVFTITYVGQDEYTIKVDGHYLSVAGYSRPSLTYGPSVFKIFSVTY
ncbi:phosphoesterase family-domain-containing protein [Dipodascopsis tothii]|uniref:phosphoesterase family-domain-containing protein n=1 Tax=Dipodascopsis tothii TaxID=44089 RepID=UPI0034CDD084